MDSISLFIDEVVKYLVDFGPFGGFFLVILEALLPILPLGVIVGLNMLSFGNIFGYLLSYVATVCGSMFCFCFFRYVVKDKFLGWFSKKNQDIIGKWMTKLTEIKFTTLVVIFAFPITPSSILNVAGGISNISVKKYFLSLLVGKSAMLLFFGYVAVSFVDSLKDPINFIRVGVLLLGAYLVSKVVERLVKVEK